MGETTLDPQADHDSMSEKLRAATSLTMKRRTMVKGGLAVAGGVAAAGYVMPSLRSLGVPGVLAASGTTVIGGSTWHGSIGFWSNSGNGPSGVTYWTTVPTDAEWTAAGGKTTSPPFDQNDLFNSFFAFHVRFSGDDNPINTINDLLEVINRRTSPNPSSDNGANEPVVKAAGEVVAAYLNASFFGNVGGPAGPYPISLVDIKNAWEYAAQTNTATRYNDLHAALEAANAGPAKWSAWLSTHPAGFAPFLVDPTP